MTNVSNKQTRRATRYEYNHHQPNIIINFFFKKKDFRRIDPIATGAASRLFDDGRDLQRRLERRVWRRLVDGEQRERGRREHEQRLPRERR